MRSATLWMLLSTASLPSVLSCGNGDSNLLVNVSNLPARAVKLSLKATLDGKPAAMAQEVNAPLDQVGVVVPQSASGHLTVLLQALDADGCVQASGQVDSDLPNKRVDLSVALQPQSPRKCGNLAPCAAGTICSISPRPVNTNLWGIWANSPSDVWAVGEVGGLVHYDGTNWQRVQGPSTTTDYNGVWGNAANNVWAVGGGSLGNIIHFDGTSWTASSNGAVYELLGVYGIGNDAWTVGRNAGLAGGVGEFWHHNGTAWSKINTGINGGLTSVWASASNDIYASGFGGVMIRGDGTTFNPVTLPVSSDLLFVYGTAANQIFSVGVSGVVLRFDGTWKKISVTNAAYNATLYGVASDGMKTYAVGNNGANGNFLTASTPFDGFTVSSPGTTNNLAGVTLGSNGIAWTCGEAGFVGYFDTRP